MKKDRDPSGSPVKGRGERKKKNWKEYTATVDDIMAFIAGRIYLRYNVVTGRVECKAPLVPPNWGDDTAQDISSPSGGRPGGGCWVPLNDRIVNSLWKEMSQQQEKVVRVQDMYRVIESDFVPEFHPFRYYLEHLPPWDGQSDYILEMSVSVNVRGDVQEQLLFAEYLKKWLVGMVRDG